jgi:hypothetical protein
VAKLQAGSGSEFLAQFVVEIQKTRLISRFDFLQQAVADLAVIHNQPLELPVQVVG